MKYVAILDSDDELSEDAINELKETAFVGDEKIPYCFEVTSIKEEPKALEKEPILDKIRDEIADLDDADYDYEGYYKAVTDALQIIDKYKEDMESEE